MKKRKAPVFGKDLQNLFDKNFWRAQLVWGVDEKIAPALEKHPEWALERDGNGFTPLMVSARAGHAKIVNLLLPHSDARAAHSGDGETALTLAISSGKAECVAALLAASDANKPFVDSWGMRSTPLEMAAQLGELEIVKLLAPAVNEHWRALQAAARNRNWECADYLSDRAMKDPDDLEALEDIVALAIPGSMPKAEALLEARDLAAEVKGARAGQDGQKDAEANESGSGEAGKRAGTGRRAPRSL